VNAILDEALVCHVGFVSDGQPFVIPTIHARAGDQVFVHGSAASRMLKTLQGGRPVCLTVTLVDGLVLARSAFHHSMNYRSVVVLGDAQPVTDEREKWDALHAIVEHVAPGRWQEVREPNAKELAGTLVLRLPIEEASAKVRTGPAARRRGGLRPRVLGRRPASPADTRARPSPIRGCPRGGRCRRRSRATRGRSENRSTR
jgi:nitroimidazol reductase NimA-like FMN-containing flavoprotein (pyridoxamine 5'-phosphate oxidase superfamily)